MNDLLDDIAEAKHEFLLAEGNLHKAKAPPLPAWEIDPIPLARYSSRHCRGCANTEYNLIGIFQVSTRGNQRKETAYDLTKPWTYAGTYNYLDLKLPEVSVCYNCL